jgi:acetoin utilization protein AcuB
VKLSLLATKNVLSVQSGDSIDKAIGLMEEHEIHHLPVIETGIVVGIVSDRDILVSVGWKLSSERKHDGRRGSLIGPSGVAEIMSKPVLTMTPEDTVQDAALRMIDRRVSAIVVARDGHVYGILTKLDLLTHARDLAKSAPARAILKQTAEEHMRVSVITATPMQSLLDVASLMHRKGLRHVPVVVEDTLVGIVSDRDIRRAFGGESIEDAAADEAGRLFLRPPLSALPNAGRRPPASDEIADLRLPASAIMDIMSKNVRTISPGTTLLDAADLMARHRIGCLPVTNEDRLVGIVTDTDLIRIISHLDA